MNEKERLRAEFDAEFLRELEAAEAEELAGAERGKKKSRSTRRDSFASGGKSAAADGVAREKEVAGTSDNGADGIAEANETAETASRVAAAERSASEQEWQTLAPFTRAVVETIRDIPRGKVMSYGQVAAAAGSPRGARQVVRILHTLSRKYALPWHRVVNIRGEIALDEHGGGGEQQERLEAEGVEFGLGGKIDLSRYRHEGDS